MEHPVEVVLGACLIVLNLTAFFTYGWDKCRAKKGQWRVPEHTLLALACAGGGVGALLGMRVFHHKTRKTKFRLGVPAAVLLWLLLLGGLAIKWDVAVLMAIFLKRFIKS